MNSTSCFATVISSDFKTLFELGQYLNHDLAKQIHFPANAWFRFSIFCILETKY